MVRGIGPATVVPTASDDCGKGIPAHHSQTFIPDEEEVAKYSSEEEETNVPASPVTNLQSDKYLQAAFNGQAFKTKSTPNDPNPSKPKDETTSSVTTGSSGTQGAPQQSNTKAQQKPAAPVIGKSLRQRSQSAVIQKQNGVELTRNYMELVRDFRQLQPFTRRPDGKYPADTLCVYCANTRPTSVFFPCQHMCVCNGCIKSNHISTDSTSATDWCACPVCMADIRLILPHSGKEEDKYWRWVLEVKPNLPVDFKREFKEAGKRLNKNATPMRGRRSSFVPMFRREPIPQEETPEDPRPKPVPALGRCRSWQPGEVANVQNVAASNEQEEAHNCAIL